MIPAILAALVCVALGMLAAERLRRRESRLNAWQGALLRLEGALRHEGAGVPQALESGAGEDAPLLRQLAKTLEDGPGIDIAKAWADVPREDCLTDPEWDCITGAVKGLQMPSLPQQIQAVALYRERLAQFVNIAREARQRCARLYPSLGWLSGAALFILLV